MYVSTIGRKRITDSSTKVETFVVEGEGSIKHKLQDFIDKESPIEIIDLTTSFLGKGTWGKRLLVVLIYKKQD